MGVAELVSAFNAVAEPLYSARKATLGYSNAHDVEWQVLIFYGTAQDGKAFVSTEQLRPGADVIAGARAAAEKLLVPKPPA